MQTRDGKDWLVLILLIALGLRAAAAVAIHSYAKNRFLFGDSHTYWMLADSLARGGQYRYGSDQGRVLRMPGYPVFLAALVRPSQAIWPVDQGTPVGSTEHSRRQMLAVRLGQAILGALAVWLVYLLGRRAWDQRVGLVAALVAAVDPVFVVFSALILSETLFSVLLLGQLLLCLAWCRANRAPGTSRPRKAYGLAGLAGVFWGLATLVRGSWMASGLLVILGFLCCRESRGQGRAEGMALDSHAAPLRCRLGSVAALLAGFTLTMAPWWIRNARVCGHFVPTTLTVGASLYDGLSQNATGASDMDFLRPVKAMGLSEYAQDRWLRRQAVQFVRDQPRRVWELAGIKFLRFWNIWPNADEFHNWPIRLAIMSTYVPVLLLGAWGAWKHRTRGRLVALLLTPLVYFCLLHLVFVASLRYRMPGMYPYAVLVAAALAARRPSEPPQDQKRTRDVYGLLWSRYGQLRPEQDEATFFAKTGFEPQELRGKRVLDAGCGSGRYLRVAGQAGAHAVGLDLSDSVFRSREVAAGSGAVWLVQGDLLRPPLAPASFDFIYAIGALEHTPDPRRAFEKLAALLRPGGRIAVWLHPKSRPARQWIDRLQRSATSRLPIGCVATLSRWAIPVGGWKRRLLASRSAVLRGFGKLLHAVSPGVSLHPDPATRCCDTFNWYAPRWRSYHTIEEVRAWFQEAGLDAIRDLSVGQRHYYEGQGAGVNLSGQRGRP